MKMHECPKYEKCSAPLCPLDSDWRLRSFGPGDCTCPFLLESVKLSAVECVPPEILPACNLMFESSDLPGAMRSTVIAAQNSPSRILQGREKARAMHAAVKRAKGN